MSVMTYRIDVSDPSPSMMYARYEFTGTYIEAVAEARRLWDEFERTVYVLGSVGLYWYHRIGRDYDTREIAAVDRNTNSGVPAREVLGQFVYP